MEYVCKTSSPLGELTLVSDGQNLTGLWMEKEKYYSFKEPVQEQELPLFEEAKRWLESYFSGEKPNVALPLAPRGSAFRQTVWRILGDIPYGETVTYGEIAAQIGREENRRVSAQAVGGAVGHNPISILIPCHRVVGADGSLTGYAGGIDKKVMLLTLEKAPMERFYIPTRGTAL
ncbi:methylated-DNA--[protein]-cysteine S-methyltransferase [Ruminococcaceae bacterium OttesenSCG-928-I18]|nr:methylated-DNA--[protein]-cysteine S-methyltransferase [Ruminococcaceae bacterium OttesenSCG-928-I18]